MRKERILVTVKTYPTLSSKYVETVCTAGVRKDGTWVRIYPVPFRCLEPEEQYKLFDWIECRLEKSSDPRPETFRPLDPEELSPVGHIETKDNWRERRELLLEKACVYERLEALISGAKANKISLAVFKPTRIVGFVWEEGTREWDPKKLENVRALTSQADLFEKHDWRKIFKLVRKLPYNFSYKFEDAAGESSKMQIFEWQIGALYWNCMRSCKNDEKKALSKVKEKYLDEYKKKDLHFFLGTTREFHLRAPNPWMIIGVFPIPHEKRLRLHLSDR